MCWHFDPEISKHLAVCIRPLFFQSIPVRWLLTIIPYSTNEVQMKLRETQGTCLKSQSKLIAEKQ